MDLLIRDKAKKKLVLVGEIIGDTLFKDVVQSKHFMRVVHGYGIQEGAFNELVKREVRLIVIREQDTGFEWEATVADWQEHGKTADYGHGRQRFLSLKYYKSHGKPKEIAEVLSERAKEEQARLF